MASDVYNSITNTGRDKEGRKIMTSLAFDRLYGIS